MIKNNVWIALATVTPLLGNKDLGNAKGAAVNVLHWARGKKDFETKIRLQLYDYGYELQKLEDIELFNFDGNYADNLKNLADFVLENKSIQWGTFYTY